MIPLQLVHDGARCAREDCEAPIRLGVVIGGRVAPIAYACTAPHLAQFMYATRHVPDRIVDALEPPSTPERTD